MAMITEIKRVRRHMLVLLDSGETIRVAGKLFADRPLAEGTELDTAEYDQWLMVRQYRDALDRAVGYLAQRGQSSGEVRSKLLRAGYRPCTADMVVYKLEKLGFLNDGTFTRQWAESRSAAGFGSRRIRDELRRKGVGEADIEAALAALDPETQAAHAEKLAERAFKHAKPGEDPRKTAQRITAALVRRGYDFETARSAIAAMPGGLAEKEEVQKAHVPQEAELRRIAEKAVRRGKPGEDPRKTARRAADALIRRGCPWERAREIVRVVMTEA